MKKQNDQIMTVQEQYLKKHRNHHRQVSFLRFFLLFLPFPTMFEHIFLLCSKI